MKFKPGDRVLCTRRSDLWPPFSPNPGDVMTVERSGPCEGCGKPILTFREAHFFYGDVEGGFHEDFFEKITVN